MSPALLYDGMSAHVRPFLGTSEQSPAEEALRRRVAAVWEALREDPAARYWSTERSSGAQHGARSAASAARRRLAGVQDVDSELRGLYLPLRFYEVAPPVPYEAEALGQPPHGR